MNQSGDPYTFPASAQRADEPEAEAGGEWLTLAAAANRVGASQAALRQAIKEGRLTSRESGRATLVWIEAQTE